MAFDKTSLENDIKQVFLDMKDAGEEATDEMFAKGLTQACKDFGESGSVATVDAGTVSSGVFAGSGSGTLELPSVSTSSGMGKIILDACTAMKTMNSGADDYLATQIGAGLDSMTLAGVVKTDVTGTTTSPQGASVPPTSGKAEGTITCVSSSLVNGLKSVFSSMFSKRNEEGFNGDEYFAEQMANYVDAYFKAGIIATAGKEALSGTVGSGTIS